MNTTRIDFRPLKAACTGLLLLGFFMAGSAQAQPAAELYRSTGPKPASELPARAKNAPGMAVRSNAHAMHAARISFELPGRGRQIAERQRKIERADGSLTWVGEFPGRKGSVISVTRRNGLLAGFFNDGQNLFEIIPGSSGEQVVFQVDVPSLPGDGEPISPDLGQTAQSSEEAPWEPPMAEADAIVQDLMVVYTPASRMAYESTGTGIEARIISAVEMANQSYINSALNVQLNLVYMGEVAYTETGDMNESLTRLRATSDGFMDTVHTLRDSYAADLVSLISEDSNYCGLGYRMSSNSTSFASWAFNVVYSACLPNQTLAHELGHNQGNTHNRESTSSTPYYPYAFGYRRCVMDGNGFLTVMSYSCSGAARVAHFSNPDVTYNGFVTGIDHDVDPGNSADTVRSMANMAPTIANFRTGASGSPPVAPDGLQAGSATENSLLLSWNDNAGDEDAYRIERSTAGGSFVEVASLAADSTSYSDSGLTPGTNYSYRVRAVNGSGYSNYSNTAAASTEQGGSSQTQEHNALSESYGYGSITGVYSDTWVADGIEQWVSEEESGGKPANRRSQAMHTWQFQIPAADSLSLHMRARLSGNVSEDVFRISYSSDGSQFTTLFEVNSTTAQDYLAILPSSLSGTVYVRAEDTDRSKGKRSLESLHVDWLAIESLSDPNATAPAAPGNLVAVEQSGEVRLNWQDNSSDETGFRVERSEDGGASWTETGNLSADATTYVDAAVTAGQSYRYRVIAFNAAGDSSASNEASISLDAGSGTMQLQASGYKTKGLQHTSLSWTGAPGNAVMRILRDGQQVGATVNQANGSSSYVDAIGKKGSGSYYYQVCEDAAPSQCSNAVMVVF